MRIRDYDLSFTIVPRKHWHCFRRLKHNFFEPQMNKLNNDTISIVVAIETWGMKDGEFQKIYSWFRVWAPKKKIGAALQFQVWTSKFENSYLNGESAYSIFCGKKCGPGHLHIAWALK